MFDVILLAAVGVSLYTDLTRRKIYNWVTVSAIVLALVLHFIYFGIPGLKSSFLGLLTGLTIFLIPFLLRGMSAGDVKLMAAIGALQGSAFVLETALVTAVLGGIYIFMLLLQKGQLGKTWKHIWQVLTLFTMTRGKTKFAWLDSLTGGGAVAIPYGTAIFAGTVLTLLVR